MIYLAAVERIKNLNVQHVLYILQVPLLIVVLQSSNENFKFFNNNK